MCESNQISTNPNYYFAAACEQMRSTPFPDSSSPPSTTFFEMEQHSNIFSSSESSFSSVHFVDSPLTNSSPSTSIQETEITSASSSSSLNNCAILTGSKPSKKSNNNNNNPTTTTNNRRVRRKSPTVVLRLKKHRRQKANDRERHRMHLLNDALERLRLVLPAMPQDQRLTKIETLRFAHNYIFALSQAMTVIKSVSNNNDISQSKDGNSNNNNSSDDNYVVNAGNVKIILDKDGQFIETIATRPATPPPSPIPFSNSPASCSSSGSAVTSPIYPKITATASVTSSPTITTKFSHPRNSFEHSSPSFPGSGFLATSSPQQHASQYHPNNTFIRNHHHNNQNILSNHPPAQYNELGHHHQSPINRHVPDMMQPQPISPITPILHHNQQYQHFFRNQQHNRVNRRISFDDATDVGSNYSYNSSCYEEDDDIVDEIDQVNVDHACYNFY